MPVSGCFILAAAALAGLYLYAVYPRTTRILEVMQYNHGVFAHRGYHNKEKLIPENSMAAFRAAVAKGYGIELDVHITKDGKLAVFHDDTLERMCQQPGDVEAYTMAELRQFHLLNTTERIPELGEVLSYVDGRVPLLIELKIPGRNLAVCKVSYQMLKDYRGRFMVQSFNTMGLYWYRKHAPGILRGQLSCNLTKSEEKESYLLRFLIRFLLLNMLGRPDFISYKLKDLPNFSVFVCRKLFGVPTAVWTLRTEEAFRQGKEKHNMCIFEKTGVDY